MYCFFTEQHYHLKILNSVVDNWQINKWSQIYIMILLKAN